MDYGAVIARTGASPIPILVSLSMMIFLRGLGEFLTHGGDISGFPPFVPAMGSSSVGPGRTVPFSPWSADA